jgi:peptide/nickel transport system substrate-binding protein
MNIILKSLTAVGLVIGLAGLTPAIADTPKKGGIFEYGVKAGIPTYDLQGSGSYGTLHRTEQHYSLLVTFDWKNFPNIVGDVAESWKISDDNLTYTFKIRKGIKFHDGTPLTSADVLASFNRLKSPKEGVISPRKAYFLSVDKFSAPDDFTFVVKFSEPFAFGLNLFATPYNAIYSKKDIERDGNWHHKNINGTGPFRFVEHQPGKKWVAKRYEDYHFDDVYLDGTIAYKIKGITQPMIGGQIMAEMRSVSPPEKKTLQQKMGDKISFHEKPTLSVWMVTLNSAFKPFQDKRVRQALTLCLDRHAGLDALHKITVTTRRTGYMLFGTQYAQSDADLEKQIGFSPDIKANRAKAKKLLKEAGYEGLEFRYSNRAVAHPYEQIAIWLIDNWKKCGLKPVMETNPSAKYKSIRSKGGFDTTIDWNASFLPHPMLMLSKYQSNSINPQNYAFVENPEIDAMYRKMNAEMDPAKLKLMAAEIENKVLDEAWFHPLGYFARSVPMLSKIKGYHITYTHAANNDWRGMWIDE